MFTNPKVMIMFLYVFPLKALLLCLSHLDLQAIWNLLFVWCEVGVQIHFLSIQIAC